MRVTLEKIHIKTRRGKSMNKQSGLRPKAFWVVRVLILLAAIVLTGNISRADAAEPGEPQDARGADHWQFDLAVYGWYSDIHAETVAGREGEITAKYAIDNFEMAFMSLLEAKKDKWSYLIDVFYIATEDDDAGSPLLRAKVELTNWIITPAVTYRFFNNDSFELSALAGARYLYIKSELTVDSQPPLPPSSSKTSDSGDNWDAIVGLRGSLKLSDTWYLPLYLDAGTGDSDFTWQAIAGIGYKFTKSDIVAGYRYIEWELDSKSNIDNLYYSGPYCGIKFHF
jgi:hypothetical protein